VPRLTVVNDAPMFVAVGLALGAAALDVGQRGWVAAHAGDGDHVQGAGQCRAGMLILRVAAPGPL
jgi:hypothetical protein